MAGRGIRRFGSNNGRLWWNDGGLLRLMWCGSDEQWMNDGKSWQQMRRWKILATDVAMANPGD